MKIPKPEEGLVINYSYLWHQEAALGREEGRKDRPCAVILASQGDRVAVAPITHTPPKGSEAIEVPPQVKKQLGLDDQRSWIVTTEVNHFTWPGHDVRPVNRQNPNQMEYGKLPPGLLNQTKREVRDNARSRSLKQVNRDDDQQQKPEKDRPRSSASQIMKKQREQSKKRKR